jgi:hypothetical protein
MPTIDSTLVNWLLQSNQTAASALLKLANKTAPAAPDAWAARVVALAQTYKMTSDKQVLVVARVAALVGDPSAANTAGAQSLSVAGISKLAEDLHSAQADVDTRAAFNHPTHWQESGDLIVPNVAGLVDKAALAWRAVTSKFKNGLAEKMFDANVRGGALAVMSVMDAQRNKQTLTVHDLTALQYVAITDGTTPRFAVPLETPTLHDTFHAAVRYGVSVLQEIFGDEFSEAMVDSLFGEEANIRIDRSRPLDQQSGAVRQIKQRLAESFSSTTTDRIASELRPLFQRPRQNEDGLGQHPSQWTGTSTENARRAEQTLEANGLLAHLNPASRQKINSLIYGAEQTGSFEAISSRFVANKNTGQFERELDGWLGQMTTLLRAESKAQGMSKAEFERKAARAIAFALVLERAAPGSLREGPLSIGLDAELAPALHTLDLRIDFPRTVREVQNALGQRP